ncbi:MAG: ribulose-phosphate 3-epimerase [Bacteroidales bacterium]
MASEPIAALDRLRAVAPALSVSILAGDLMALGRDLSRLEEAGVSLLHLDVMDGCFTPMMTLGPPVIRAMKTSMLKDVHLMIDEPLGKVAEYVAAGADIVTVHAESCVHIHRVLQYLGTLKNVNDPARGLVRGVALNPGTPIETIKPLLDEIDLVVLLAINPGWGGQSFLQSTRQRVDLVRRMTADCGRHVLVGVDGGITRGNVASLAGAGVDLVVTGSAVFEGGNVAENVRTMAAALSGQAT